MKKTTYDIIIWAFLLTGIALLLMGYNDSFHERLEKESEHRMQLESQCIEQGGILHFRQGDNGITQCIPLSISKCLDATEN